MYLCAVMVKRINRVSGQTPYRQELRERILKAAMSEFFEKGIKAVKMDDIARRLSISKRTVYEIYSNKEELLLEGMKAAEQDFDEHMKDFSEQDNHHVMDTLIEFYNCQAQRLSKISPLFLDEVQKYKRVQAYLENKHKKRDEDAYNFIDRGVKEGFFRPDTNYHIVVEVAREAVRFAMTSQLYKEHGLQMVFRNIILLFIRGICTLNGLKMFERIE